MKAKTNVIEGITGLFEEQGERHQRGMVGLLNGAEMFEETPTIDQMLADHWKTAALGLGATNDTPVLGNFDKPDYVNHVSRAHHGLIDDLMA